MDYKVTDTQLTGIANAIRTKGGTSAQLEFPAGFVSAVNAIPTGGGGGDVELMSKSAWDALTIAQKQAKGLVAVQDALTGFLRGRLVNGHDYNPAKIADMVPVYSWNASNNAVNSYSFDATSPSGGQTQKCLAITLQNGNSFSSNSNLPLLESRAAGNGTAMVRYGDYSSGAYADTYSSGNNWNNSEIVCFEFSGDAYPETKELFFEQGQNGTYTLQYEAEASEQLLLVFLRGGQAGDAYTINGLTQKSIVTSSGARVNGVYFGELSAGDVVDISIPYAAGLTNNGALLVALFSVVVDSEE